MLAVHYNNLPFVLHYNFTHLVIAGTVVEHKVLTPGKKETETQWLTEPLLMAPSLSFGISIRGTCGISNVSFLGFMSDKFAENREMCHYQILKSDVM